jgi:hypothetical protein
MRESLAVNSMESMPEMRNKKNITNNNFFIGLRYESTIFSADAEIIPGPGVTARGVLKNWPGRSGHVPDLKK